MPYTATTHANPVRVTCEPLHRPDVHGLRESDDPGGRSGAVHYRFEVTPTFERYLDRPPVRVVETIANLAPPMQSGDMNLCVLWVGGRGDRLRRVHMVRGQWLTRGVASVGLTSFFSDAGHEITTSVLPSFVTVTLRSSAGALGVIEGISDALTGVAKLFAGPIANGERLRLRMASGGYLVTAAATGAVGLAATVWQAGLLRATAWTARGVRSPARDAMLASLAPHDAYGRAFGLERAGDNLGAVAGPLLAAGLVA